MSTHRFAVEGLMDEMELKYFSREDDAGANWILLFAQGGVMIRLAENGEFLLVRSFPLAKMNSLNEQQQANLSRQLLKRNHALLLGHYSVDEEVVFEATMPIEDGDLTAQQFKRLVGVIAGEIGFFQGACADFCRGGTPNSVNMDQLLQSLFGGAAESATEPAGSTEGASSENAATEPVAGPQETPDPAPEDGFDVVLTSVGTSQRDVIEAVRHLSKRSLGDTKQLIERAPTRIGRWGTRSEAEQVVRELAAAGAAAVIV